MTLGDAVALAAALACIALPPLPARAQATGGGASPAAPGTIPPDNPAAQGNPALGAQPPGGPGATGPSSAPAGAGPATTQPRRSRFSIDAGVGSELTWSSNPELGSGSGREDTILDVRPHIAVTAIGPRVQLRGAAALDAVASANGTQPNRVLPEADVNGRVEAIERLFFVESGVRAQQTSVNPFGPRPDNGTTRNTLTATSVHVTPSIERDFTVDTRLRLRSDNRWSREYGAGSAAGAGTAAASLAEGYFARHSALVEHDPRPLGWRVEAQRSRTRYRNDVQEPFTEDVVRASVDYALGVDWSAGVRVGRERTSLLPNDPNHTITGVQARWQPSPRTTLDGFAEKRFFGRAWNLDFAHRLPRAAIGVTLSRALDTTPQSLFDLPAFDNVTSLLDSVLTSRFPDPVERARLVQELIARQGLPSQSLSPLTLFLRRVSIVTSQRASLALLGVRNTVTLAAYQTRTEDATPSDPLVTPEAFVNNAQRGVSASLAHRLSPTMGFTVTTDWSRVRALRSAERSTERSLRARLNAEVGPKTTAFAGLRLRWLDSNTVSTGHEAAVFVGLDYHF